MSKSNSKAFIFIFLGMLAAFAPAVTDMYLPVLPAMSGYFDTTASMVQMGLTASLIGLAIGQLFFGHLSDKYGRKVVLISALALFIVATIGCLLSKNITQFNVMRFLQGMGGSGGIVISRAVAADKCDGRELIKILGIIGGINGVMPVVAPVVGGGLASFSGWHGIFLGLLFFGIFLMAGALNFKESLPPENRVHVGSKDLFKNFRTALSNKQFLFYVLQFTFANGVLFSYISSAPFIMQEYYEFNLYRPEKS